jgi:hypothetical protein
MLHFFDPSDYRLLKPGLKNREESSSLPSASLGFQMTRLCIMVVSLYSACFSEISNVSQPQLALI